MRQVGAMLRMKAVHRERAGSAAAVAAVHALLGYLLLTGLGFELPLPERNDLTLIDVFEAPPPPPAEPPRPEKVEETKEPKPKDPEGAAAPPALKNTPTEIVVPPPKIELKLPPPIPAAPVAGQGTAPAAGAAPVPGPGTGRGGIGTGLGSGLSGTGTGGGGGGIGGARRARHIAGSIDARDYPERAFERGVTGVVYMQFVVTPQGRARNCRITRSSGSAELDAVTCRLIERRFRYRPALDSVGRPTSETIRGEHHWEIGRRPTIVEEEEEEWEE